MRAISEKTHRSYHIISYKIGCQVEVVSVHLKAEEPNFSFWQYT